MENLPSREFDFQIQSAPTRSSIEVGIKNSEFSDVKYLSSGSNAAVYTAIWNSTLIAIKMLKPKINDLDLAIQEMNIEIQILLKASHSNIINISGIGEKPRKFMVLEYLGGGTLDKLLEKFNPKIKEERQFKSRHHSAGTVGLPWEMSLSIAIELASALKYLHNDFHFSATIIHRGKLLLLRTIFVYAYLSLYYKLLHVDLKPQNIGFTGDMRMKLFDFGLAACVKKKRLSCETYKMTGLTGTRQYMAPEVSLQKPYNEKVDVYSFAILLWQMITGEQPYSDMTPDEHTQLAMVEGERPSLSSILVRAPEGVCNILESCWHSNFDHRSDIGSVLRDLTAFTVEVDQDIIGTSAAASSVVTTTTSKCSASQYNNTTTNSGVKLSSSAKVKGNAMAEIEEDLTFANRTKKKPVHRRRSVAQIKF